MKRSATRIASLAIAASIATATLAACGHAPARQTGEGGEMAIQTGEYAVVIRESGRITATRTQRDGERITQTRTDGILTRDELSEARRLYESEPDDDELARKIYGMTQD